MTGNDKARLLGLFFWLFTAFNILIVAIIAVVYLALFGAIISQAPNHPGSAPPVMLMPILIIAFAFAFVFTVLFSIPKIVAGYGLRNKKPWARGWAIAASIMACMSFPLGTAVGVFGLVFLFGDDGKRYFGEPGYGPGELQAAGVTSAPTAPPPNSWQ